MIMTAQLSIIHFNDIYNVESSKEGGGAARFLTAVNTFGHLKPLILFSGDAFSPSRRTLFLWFVIHVHSRANIDLFSFWISVSTYTKGEQMIPVLNRIGTHCAVLGNHDFGMCWIATLFPTINDKPTNLNSIADHGLDVITEHIAKTKFPWLMSNVIDNETGRPLGSGMKLHTMVHNGIKVGLMGLVEKEWLDTLPTIDIKEGSYSCSSNIFHFAN